MLSRASPAMRTAMWAARPLSRGLVRAAVVGSGAGASATSEHADTSRFWKLASLALAAGAGTLSLAHAEAKVPEERNPPSYLHPTNVDEPYFDRSTGLKFQKKVSVETDAKLNTIHTLVGTGCKYKYGMVKLYAVGLYLPPGYAKPSGSDDLVLAPVVNGDLSGTLIIRMHRETELGDLIAHLEETLRANIKVTAQDQEKANIAINLFRDMILGGADTLSLSRGSSLMFVREGDKVWLHAHGTRLGCIQSSDLARALFAVFLGPNPLSEEAKAAFAKGIKGDKYSL